MRRLCIYITLIFIAGCAGLPKEHKYPENKESAILGISIKTRSLFRISKNRPETIYFIKIEGEGTNILGSKIYPSTFIKKDNAYLVNAKPGKYAAVASSFSKSDMGYNTFYDKKAIESTIVEVKPGELTFAGKFIIDDHLKNLSRNIEKNGDKAQIHFYNLLKSFMYGTFYCGTLNKADRSRDVEREFMTEARKDFIDSGWMDMINKRIEALDTEQ